MSATLLFILFILWCSRVFTRTDPFVTVNVLKFPVEWTPPTSNEIEHNEIVENQIPRLK